MHHIGTQTLRGRNITSIHPLRIALFSPVDERRLTLCKACLLIIDSPHIHLKRLLDHRIYSLKPLHISCHLIDLPSRSGPDHTVCTARPCTACSCILHNLALRVNLAKKTGHCRLWLHISHRKDDTIAHVTSPHTAPLKTGTQRAIRLHRIDALIHRHIVHRLLDSVRSRELRKRRNIVLLLPHKAIAIIVRHNPVRSLCYSSIYTFAILCIIDRRTDLHHLIII